MNRQQREAKEPSSIVELTLWVRHLADKDVLSKSDPVCIIYNGSVEGYGKKRVIRRTETFASTINFDVKILLKNFFSIMYNLNQIGARKYAWNTF